MKGFTDLVDVEEDDRIDIIGNSVMKPIEVSTEKPRTAAVMVEDNKKADRYIEKMKIKFPRVRVINRFDGPVVGAMVTVVFGGPLHG